MSSGNNRTIQVEGPAIPQSSSGESLLQLRGLRGEERLSTVYRYELELVTPPEPDVSPTDAANIDLKAMIGKRLSIITEIDGMGPSATGKCRREISGLVFEARFIRQGDRRGYYRVVVMPWIQLADGHTDYRIFQKKTVVDILDEVLSEYPFSVEKRLTEIYPMLDFQTQYGETDLAFMQRLMQEFGIYWFYVHENGFHRLILADGMNAHQETQSSAYHTLNYLPPERRTDTEHVSEIDVVQTWQSGSYTTNDWDFKQPTANLSVNVQKPQPTALNTVERYEWPGDYTGIAQGNTFANVRMQQISGRGQRIFGRGILRDVECGTRFTLAGCPQQEANQGYLCIAAMLEVSETGDTSGTASNQYSFVVDFEAMPDSAVFRPERTIPKPRTTGPQPAIVTGVAGSEIYTDNYARVKVRFLWDRSGTSDENSSPWLRVMYQWAGQNYGTIHVPRVGTEVVVDFVNGDPDRPVVLGQMYNAQNMPPWPLPGNATQSGVLTRSSKGGGYSNANAIRFEDKKGSEQLWLHAEKDMLEEAEHDLTHHVGNNEVSTIGANRSETVSDNETLVVGGNRSETIKGMQTQLVDLASLETIGLFKMLNVGAAYSINVGAAMNTLVGLSNTMEVLLSMFTKVGKRYSLNAGERVEFVVGAASITMGYNLATSGQLTDSSAVNGHNANVTTTGNDSTGQGSQVGAAATSAAQGATGSQVIAAAMSAFQDANWPYEVGSLGSAMSAASNPPATATDPVGASLSATGSSALGGLGAADNAGMNVSGTTTATADQSSGKMQIMIKVGKAAIVLDEDGGIGVYGVVSIHNTGLPDAGDGAPPAPKAAQKASPGKGGLWEDLLKDHPFLQTLFADHGTWGGLGQSMVQSAFAIGANLLAGQGWAGVMGGLTAGLTAKGGWLSNVLGNSPLGSAVATAVLGMAGNVLTSGFSSAASGKGFKAGLMAGVEKGMTGIGTALTTPAGASGTDNATTGSGSGKEAGTMASGTTAASNNAAAIGNNASASGSNSTAGTGNNSSPGTDGTPSASTSSSSSTGTGSGLRSQ